jgi:predicted ribosomally synthesized peptide with nif11-like leader
MSSQNLERFRELVHREPALQEQLIEPSTTDDFLALVLQVGRARGFDFTEGDVHAAMQASRRAWMERWIR